MRAHTLLKAAICLFILALAVPAFAQVRASFDMSTPFWAGGAKLPAGSYTAQSTGEEGNLLQIKSNDGSHTVILDCRQSNTLTKGAPQIIFNKYGDADYVAAVHTQTQSVDILPAGPEKAAAKKGKPQQHSVAGK